MKLYDRKDFIKLPKYTIYSRINQGMGELFDGLYSKTTSYEDMQVDWCEQDLIGECGFPEDIVDGCDALRYQLNKRDTYQHFETDLECSGRDGMYEEKDQFVVWDENDITKLRDYLNKALEEKIKEKASTP